MKKSLFGVLFLSITMFMSSAHAQFGYGQQTESNTYGQKDVPSGKARTVQSARMGIVVDVQSAQIEVQASGGMKAVAGILGGLIGAAASQRESWQTQAAIGGLGVAGAGYLADKLGREMRQATEYIIQMGDGTAMSLVQETSDPINVGEKVFVVGSGNTTRVLRAANVALQ